MPTKNVVVTERQAKLINRLVSSGQYQNASEVLREGLRLIELRSAEEKAKLKALREAAQVGIDDLEAGRYRDFDNFDDLDRHLKAVADDVIRGKPRAAE
ncbi:MAG TPA: type II toxin-antitoxin system ParD family antitoxin [Rhizomicrobium sp.]|jgi:antitoxin ParD1/3/4